MSCLETLLLEIFWLNFKIKIKEKMNYLRGLSRSLCTTSKSNHDILKKYCFPRAQNGLQSVVADTVKVSVTPTGVATVTLNRPSKLNAFNMEMWEDLYNVFNGIKHDEKVKVVILNGSNNNFSTGMDLEVFAEMSKLSSLVKCEGRKREGIENLIFFFQDCISAPEITCPVPVIAAISGYCIGGAVDLIAACDMRYCTNSSNFSIKETDLAMVADIGTLQRLPKLIGDSQTRELAYTSRIFNGTEAEKLGLALKSFNTDEELMSHVNKLAESIALKSPLTIRGIKKTLLYSRDHTVKDSLYQVNLHNTAYLYNADLMEATKAHLTKAKPSFTLP